MTAILIMGMTLICRRDIPAPSLPLGSRKGRGGGNRDVWSDGGGLQRSRHRARGLISSRRNHHPPNPLPSRERVDRVQAEKASCSLLGPLPTDPEAHRIAGQGTAACPVCCFSAGRISSFRPQDPFQGFHRPMHGHLQGCDTLTAHRGHLLQRHFVQFQHFHCLPLCRW